jgi:hypothetical protein
MCISLPEPTNQLGQLIRRKMSEQGLTRKEIALALNYKNPHKGFARLDACLNHGESNPDFLGRLLRVLKVEQNELIQEAEKTSALLEQRARELMEIEQRLLEERERAAFTPHLWAQTTREGASPIFILALLNQNRYRRIDLVDGIETLPEQTQVELVGSAAKRHFESNKGFAGPFGAIHGYRFQQSFDVGLNLSTDGRVIDRNAGRLFVPKFELFTRKRRIDPLLRHLLDDTGDERKGI